MEKKAILGKSSYAIGIILDIIKLSGMASDAIQIVSNIPDEENDSLLYPYKLEGFNIKECDWRSWKPETGQRLILGSIGKGRQKIYHFFSTHFELDTTDFINIIHPSSVIGAKVEMGNGVHISPLSVVAPFAVLNNFVVVNRQCSIGHHAIIHDFVSINPGVTISGICEIGNNSIIGSGATVLDQVKIGKHSVIGAGSVVTKDIPDHVVAYGVPAKIIRENTQ